MRSQGILHAELSAAIATLGHGEIMVLGDAGLTIPPGVQRIDLGLVEGIPSITEVLAAVLSELSVESAVIASEWAQWNPPRRAEALALLSDLPIEERPHLQLRADMEQQARVWVRTGECTAYANVCLVAGVRFSGEAERTRASFEST